MRKDADMIIKEAIQKVLPDEAVSEALRNKSFGNGRIYVVAAGKAAWQMAKTAVDALEHKIEAGLIVSIYRKKGKKSMANIDNIYIIEYKYCAKRTKNSLGGE